MHATIFFITRDSEWRRSSTKILREKRWKDEVLVKTNTRYGKIHKRRKKRNSLTKPRALITKEAVTKVFFVLVKFLAKRSQKWMKKSVVLWEIIIKCRQHYYSLRIKIYKLFIYLFYCLTCISCWRRTIRMR